MFFLSWLTALGSGMGSVCLSTLTLSPVRIDWSIFRVVERIFVTLMSAGILSPTGGETGEEEEEEEERDGEEVEGERDGEAAGGKEEEGRRRRGRRVKE